MILKTLSSDNTRHDMSERTVDFHATMKNRMTVKDLIVQELIRLLDMQQQQK